MIKSQNNLTLDFKGSGIIYNTKLQSSTKVDIKASKDSSLDPNSLKSIYGSACIIEATDSLNIMFSGGGIIESVKIKAKDCITISWKGDLVCKNSIFEAKNISMLSTESSSYALLTDSNLNSNTVEHHDVQIIQFNQEGNFMKSSNYNGILSQIEQVEATKKTISTLTELSGQQPNAHQFIAIAQDKLNKDSQVLNGNLDKMEAECIRLESNLAEANKVVNEKRAFEIQIKNQVQQTEKSLKEAISKNQELDLKINTSGSELTNLTQERQTLIADKLNLVSNMNDQQKHFVLTKARANQDVTIEGLILNSGFNEQEYLASQQQEQQPDELEDIFAQQLNINPEIQQKHHEVDVQPTGENLDTIFN